MRWSRTLIPTLKEVPAEARVPSHVFMLRAGLVRMLAAGTYSYLPLGWRALNKAVAIVREEMDRAGALEVHLPALHPAELWQESGRLAIYGEDLLTFKDRHGRQNVLGPTHEEVITDIVRREVKSYRQLPVNLYQIQTKFRDELRPRFGILRSREFLMKDAYSFDRDLEGLNASYDKMYAAYCRIFSRCGLPAVAVEAESGAIGGDVSHEFMVPSPTGEDTVLRCPGCGYAANRERAERGPSTSSGPAAGGVGEAADPPAKVATPGASTVEDVAKLLGVEPAAVIKTLIYVADGKPAALLVRGDHELNETKAKRALGAGELAMADAGLIERETGGPLGFSGPVGLKLPLWVDPDAAAVARAVVGANEGDQHLRSVVPGRDFPLDRVVDLRYAEPGDRCPRCAEGKIERSQGIEVGHVFKLGTRYSRALKATYLEEDGKEREMIMGCYGIGVNRILAAAIETSHDKDGIVWPVAIAPYQVEILPLAGSGQIAEIAGRLERELEAAGRDVLVDDRDLRPGVKFKDADLVGLPLRITVGEKGLKRGVVELKSRDGRHQRECPPEEAAAAAGEILQALTPEIGD